MSDDKKGQGFKLTLFALVGLFCQIILVLSVLSPEIFISNMNKELSLMDDVYGREIATQYYDDAKSKSDALVVDSGVLNYMRYMFLPDWYIEKRPNNEHSIFKSMFTFVDNAIHNLFLNVEYTLLRINSFKAWVALFILTVIGSVSTGALIRKVKQHGFEYSSPHRLKAGKFLIVISLFMLYVFLVLPLTIHPFLFPLVIFIFNVGLVLFIANIIKRV